MLGAVARWWRGQWVEVTRHPTFPNLCHVTFHDGGEKVVHLFAATRMASAAGILRRWRHVYGITLTVADVDGQALVEFKVPDWARQPLARAFERAAVRLGVEQHVGPAQRRWAYR